jgi:SAM-dependent MidA family methyltransferase
MTGPDLHSFLQALQEECGGFIPFERFMQEALYHPRHGYYSANIRSVGADGDFSTSATLDPGLGKAIAAWILKKAVNLGWKRVPVIEIGAGSGELARSVLHHLGWKNRWRIHYQIHETSPILRSQQKNNLRWHRVRWIDSLPEALRKHRGRAIIFSNELVDAFACRLFVKGEDAWREIGVRIHPDGSLSEVLIGSIQNEAGFDVFSHLPTGQRVERHDSYRIWLDSWSKEWLEGSLLTIDYGDLAQSLYERRPGGSLRSYWKHARFSGMDLYARFGKQDLTADVNFSDLIDWGCRLGWQSGALLTQSGFIAQMAGSSQAMSLSGLPDEAGEAFKVLEQSPLH